MKKLILPFAALLVLSTSAFAQEEPEVNLETFEQCNNWARHYCQSGNHEMAVNRELLRLKKAGIPITLARIKMLAQRIKPSTYVPPKQEG